MERSELARLLGAPARVGEQKKSPVVVREADPARFMAAFADAVSESGPVFLADPSWRTSEWAQLTALLPVTAVPRVDDLAPLQRAGQPIASETPPRVERGWLCIPSGGTSGVLKFARHDEDTVAAAVRGFCAHFDVRQVNAVGVLPHHHVSGLMAWMRCALTGGTYCPWDWKRLESGERPVLGKGDWFLSLVPTQLRRLLESPEAIAWLRSFRAIFVGGGPAWLQLMEAAAAARLPISFSYGMTETAAMVAALRPAEFLAGARSVGAPLPHAQLTLDREGRVQVAGESVFRGYWPEWREPAEWVTEDLAHFDDAGHLNILGRCDAVIITGGKKVQPAEVEAALRATGEFDDVAVLGVPDSEWGEIVVACYSTAGRPPDLAKVERAIARHLPSHLRPKRYVAVADWPRTAEGKLNRSRLARLAGA